ncbi:MAG TPA: HepT-like ribonuclease domain-containing protein [Rhizomicrobium sp.]|nr:HepT-like ribonuclease domain-containing protein [Rhizomicrobium sp.]
MSSDQVQRRLLHIRDNIGRARDFIAALDFDAFAADQKTVYATMRALEIISEASRHLPEDLKARHSEIDWVAVRDAGNIYRHAYDLVTERRLWDTVTMHLAPLERAVLDELSRFV